MAAQSSIAPFPSLTALRLDHTGYIYFRLAVAYLRCQRDLQRIKAVTLSPIISGFDTTLIGIVTIRAFSAEKRFLDEFHGQMDTTTAAEWWIWMCNRWLLYRFDAIGAFTTYTAIVLVLYTETSAALGAVSLTNMTVNLDELCLVLT